MNKKRLPLLNDEQIFYEGASIERTKSILNECLNRYDKDGNLYALELAFKCNKNIIEMTEEMAKNYYSGVYRNNDNDNESLV